MSRKEFELDTRLFSSGNGMTSTTKDCKPVGDIDYISALVKEEERQASGVCGLKSANAAEIEARRRKCQALHKKESNTATSETVICTGKNQRGSDEDSSNRGRGPSQNTEVQFIPRTISPTFGATSFDTFDARYDRMSSGIAIMLSKVIWPAATGEAVSQPWFQDFCTSPVLYHAHCVVGASYRDFVAKNFLWSGSKATIIHRISAVLFIREQLAGLDSMSAQDIEKLIFATTILAGSELEPRLLVDLGLPFTPHIPTSDLPHLCCRLGPVVALQNAAFALVRRQSGLHKLHYPGLAPMVALLDLVHAASNLHRPALPCYWTAHVVDVLPENIDDEQFLTSARRPGVGFFKLPGGLPHLAALVLAEIACLDRIMSTFQERTPTGRDLVTLLDARNATLHRLLSLPPWDALTQEGRENSHRKIYEICRITAMIYCNGVVLSIPPYNDWNDRLTAMLVQLLTTANFETWGVNVSELHVWALLIGGMAAEGTSQRPFFEDALKRWYITHRRSWAAIVASLKEFVWSDRACKAAGAGLLHRSLFGSDA